MVILNKINAKGEQEHVKELSDREKITYNGFR